MAKGKIDTAIVIGAGITGLSTAKILSDYCREVIIVEKAESVGTLMFNQSNHAHVLLSRGYDDLIKVFPNLKKNPKLSDSRYDVSNDCHWVTPFGIGQKFVSNVFALSITRDKLNTLLLSEVERIQNVKLLFGSQVQKIQYDNQSNQVYGVEIATSNGSLILASEIVVDTSGFNSITENFLMTINSCKQIPVTVAKSTLTYASRKVKSKGLKPDWKVLLIENRPPLFDRAALVTQTADDEFIVTLSSINGSPIGKSDTEFYNFATSLQSVDLVAVLDSAVDCGETFFFNSSQSTVRNFEKLRIFPKGLFIMGDAVAQFSPYFGLNMTLSFGSLDIIKKHIVRMVDVYPSDREIIGRQFLKEMSLHYSRPMSYVKNMCKRWNQCSIVNKSIKGEFIEFLWQKSIAGDRKTYLIFLKILHFKVDPKKLFGLKSYTVFLFGRYRRQVINNLAALLTRSFGRKHG